MGGSKRSILVILLAFGPAILLLLLSLGKCSNNYQELPVIADIPSYRFVDSENNEITNETQKDYITIFTTIQTSCPRTCAIDVFKVNLTLYQKLWRDQKDFDDIKIVSIVTDENGEPVEDVDLVNFILDDMIEGYNPEIWKIVSGDPAQIYNIENDNGDNLYLYEDEDAFAGKSYLETLLLVDKSNRLRYLGLGNQEGYIRDFKQHLALLKQEYKKIK